LQGVFDVDEESLTPRKKKLLGGSKTTGNMLSATMPKKAPTKFNLSNIPTP